MSRLLDLISPIGNEVIYTSTGAQTLTVPSGASGIVFSVTTGVQTFYFSFTNALTDTSEHGFSQLATSKLEDSVFWFDPVQVPYVYVNISGGSLRYQWLGVS